MFHVYLLNNEFILVCSIILSWSWIHFVILSPLSSMTLVCFSNAVPCISNIFYLCICWFSFSHITTCVSCDYVGLCTYYFSVPTSITDYNSVHRQVYWVNVWLSVSRSCLMSWHLHTGFQLSRSGPQTRSSSVHQPSKERGPENDDEFNQVLWSQVQETTSKHYLVNHLYSTAHVIINGYSTYKWN